MPGEEVDVSQLSASQQEVLQTYIAVTGQEAAEAVPLLQRSQWNVQVGTALLQLIHLDRIKTNLNRLQLRSSSTERAQTL
jgi:hypothetical protein